MKEFRKFLIAQILIISVLLSVLFIVVLSGRKESIDVAKANDLVQTAKENWDDIDILKEKYGARDILIFDRFDRLKYASSDKLSDEVISPFDALKKNMVVLPVSDDDVFLGSIIFRDPAKGKYDKTIEHVLIITIIVTVIILLSYAAFFIYINRKLIKPFQRMKRYAGLIAQGRLDEPVQMERGNIFGIFSESFDTMREELQASRDRETALKIKEKELVASLSHDLKTPVTGIKLTCELLQVKAEDEYIRKKIENIDHKTEEINVLLNNLLSSALDDLNEMNVSCSEVTSDILDQLIDEHDPYRKVGSHKALGCILNIDKNRISQVIGNIISNSYKYAGTAIDISYEFYESYLKMEIRDHGKGVEPEELQLITQKFYRGKNNTKDKEGSGLGLYISRELMEKMKGELICKSDENGFVVILMIPLA